MHFNIKNCKKDYLTKYVVMMCDGNCKYTRSCVKEQPFFFLNTIKKDLEDRQ